MSKKSNFKYIGKRYSYTKPQENAQDINISINQCNATIREIRDHFEESKSLDNVKKNVERTIKNLETALNKIKNGDAAIDESAKRVAMMTNEMLKELKNIFILPPHRESSLGSPPAPLASKEKMQRTKRLCKAYEDAVWKEFQPKYQLHPGVKVAAIAAIVLVAAVIGFAAAVVISLPPAPFPLGTLISYPTIGKAVTAGIFGAVSLGCGIPLTHFFEKRRVPGETMQKTHEVAKATKAFAKEMRDREQIDNPVPRPKSEEPVYTGL